MTDLERIAKAARTAARLRREANTWNHNPIEVAANTAVAEGLEELALELESQDDGD